MLRTRPFEGRWTPNESIVHLTDGEWVHGYHPRLILRTVAKPLAKNHFPPLFSENAASGRRFPKKSYKPFSNIAISLMYH
jgi:hypothetical protein